MNLEDNKEIDYFTAYQEECRKNHVLEVEKDRMSSLIHMLNIENQLLRDHYWDEVGKDAAAEELRVIKATKGFRLLQKCWRTIDKIKGRG